MVTTPPDPPSIQQQTVDDRKVEEGDLSINAHGVTVHAMRVPRTAFRKMVDGSLRNSFAHSFLTKGTADQDRHRAERASAGEAHDLDPGRTDHGPASGRHRAPAGVAEPHRGRRAHGAADRAPPRRHQGRRPRDRPRARRRPRRRRGRRHRHARGRGRVQGVPHGTFLEKAPASVTGRGRSNPLIQLSRLAQSCWFESSPASQPCKANRLNNLRRRSILRRVNGVRSVAYRAQGRTGRCPQLDDPQWAAPCPSRRGSLRTTSPVIQVTGRVPSTD